MDLNTKNKMKSKKLIKFQNDWNNVTKLRMFEIEVINQNNEQDYIIFDIELHGCTFVAYHVGLTEKQEKSKKVACQKWVCDVDFSIDENLQALYDVCIGAIISSTYFKLPE